MRPKLTPLLSQLFLCLLLAALYLWVVQPASAEGPASAAPVSQTTGSGAGFTYSVPGQTGTNPNVAIHQAVNFEATAPQGSVGYTWSFGDGSPSANGPKVAHTFSSVDDYTVTLTSGVAGGQTASSTQTVRVVPIVQSLVSTPPLKQVAIGTIIPATLYVQAPGLADVNANLTGDLINGKPTAFSTPDQLSYAELSGQVANETNSTVDAQIIQKPGGSIPLKGNVGVELTYKTPSGSSVDLVWNMDLQKDLDASKGVWSITYPDFSLYTGKTDPSQPDTDGYYLKGDSGFHHPDDPLVRKYAMSAARAGGTLSDDPGTVMDHLFSFVRGLMGSDDPAQLDIDSWIVQKIVSGALVPGAQSQKYICISQTYFLTSLARTLGLPSRELTVALANPVSQLASGAWKVDYVQEGAAEVWYDSAWHLYDTWYGLRSFDEYLSRKYAYQAWFSYSPQNYQLVAKNGDPLGLYGHDFAIGENEGSPAKPDEWNYRAAKERSGVAVDGFPTS
jgi:PKD repeat protein